MSQNQIFDDVAILWGNILFEYNMKLYYIFTLVLCVMFCRSLFVLLYIFFWPLRYLSFFNIRILITPLVSSNSFHLMK